MPSNGTPWKIKEIDAKLMPPAGSSKWWFLFREITLRLEQTPSSMALEITLHDGGASGALKAISRYANERMGEGMISLSHEVTPDGQEILYVRRGTNYTD